MSVSYGPKLGLMINALTGDAHDIAFRAFLRALDQLPFLAVKSRTLTAPPGSPANGDAYIVATGGTGSWSGHDKSVAVWTTDNPLAPSGEWEFYVPAAGWLAFSVADAGFYSYSGTAWAAFGGGSATLAANTDVVISAPANNDVLTYETSSTKWKNKPASGGGSSTLAADTDVVITSPANNDVLTYETSSTKWKNKPASGGGAPTAIAGVNNQTGTSYVLVLGDAGFLVRMNNAAANTCTIPPHSSVAFPLDTVIAIRQVGGGITTIVAGAGVTITSPGSLAIASKNGTVYVIQVATDTWDLIGDVAAAVPVPVLVAHTSAGTSAYATPNPLVTPAIDTTGANFLVVYLECRADPASYPNTVTDSKGNTWHALPCGGGLHTGALFYAYNATCGTGHTFSVTSSNWQSTGIEVQAWSGIKSSSDPLLAGSNQYLSSVYTGITETPAHVGDLIIFGCGGELTGPYTVNQGFTISDSNFGLGGANPDVSVMAYLVAPSTSPVTPTFTSGGGVGNLNAAIFAHA